MKPISWKNEKANFLAAYQRIDEEDRLARTLRPASGRERQALRTAGHRTQDERHN